MKSLAYISAALLLLAQGAAAQEAMYRWTDKNGTVHFTDDLDRVPAKYRGQVQATDGGPLTVLPSPPRQATSGQVMPGGEGAPDVTPPGKQRKEGEASGDGAGKPPERAESLQEELAKDQARLDQLTQERRSFVLRQGYGYPMATPEIEALQTRIDQEKAELEQLKGQPR